MSSLPRGWSSAQLAELGANGEQTVLTGPFGANLGKEDFVASGVPVFTIGCLGTDQLVRSKLLYISPDKAAELEAYRLRSGDFLFSRMASVGRAGIVPTDLEGAIFNYHLMRVRLANQAIEPRLFYYFIRGAEVVESYLKEVSRGATRDGINTKLLLALPVSLPPFREQRRIVAKIDSLSSKSKRAREHLDHIPRLVEKHKQAVLAAAFRGELTQRWRQCRSIAPVCPRSVDEIREKYRGAGIFNEPYELPINWKWLRLPELGELDRGRSRHRPRNDPSLFGGAYPFIQTGDVRAANGVVRHWSETYSDTGLLQSKLWPSGTVCITIAANIAESAVLAIDACFPDSVVGFIGDPDKAEARYVEFFIRTARSELQAFAPATAQKNINLDTLAALRVPVAPVAEQAEIVRRIDHAFTWIDRLAAEATSARKLIDRLDQAVLAKAFRGELVPQDPNDEPASVLLERIRAERETAPAAKLRRGRAKRS